MKNKVQDGYVVEAISPADVEAGDPVGIGDALFGVAAGAAKGGERLPLAVFGVFRISAIEDGVSFSAGDRAYFDPTLKKMTDDNTKMPAGLSLGGQLFRLG